MISSNGRVLQAKARFSGVQQAAVLADVLAEPNSDGRCEADWSVAKGSSAIGGLYEPETVGPWYIKEKELGRYQIKIL
jgi:hypothetical protein